MCDPSACRCTARPTQRLPAGAALSLLALLAAASPAFADDVTSRGFLIPGERVRDTIPPDGGRRTAGLSVLSGAPCTVTARAIGTSRVRPSLVFRDPAGDVVDVGTALREKGGTSRLRAFRFGDTGTYRVTLTTPRDAGGAFELSYAARPAAKWSVRGASAGDPAQGTLTFDALAGTLLTSLSVSVSTKPVWAPTVELLAPDGSVLATVSATGGKATIRDVTLTLLGTYTVRVTGGAGAFRASASLRPPPKSARTWAGVEATPLVTSVSPATSANDQRISVVVRGVAISTQHSLRFSQGGVLRFARLLDAADENGGSVNVDLEGVAPGTYELALTSAAGVSVPVAEPFVVTNRPAVVTQADPRVVPNGAGNGNVVLTLLGAGIDPGASVELRLASSGALLPATVSSRVSHGRIELTFVPPDFVTGPCTLDVADPGASPTRLADAIDLIGPRAASKSVWTYTGGTWFGGLVPSDAEYDPETGHALIAAIDGVRGVLLLVDCATRTLLDSRVLTPGGTAEIDTLNVAWNPTSHTWGVAGTTFVNGSTLDTAFHYVLDDADLDSTVGSATLANPAWVVGADIAPNLATGGWLAAFDSWAGGSSRSEVRVQAIGADGVPDPAGSTVTAYATDGILSMGAICSLPGNRFVVVYESATGTGSAPTIALRRTIVDARGVLESAPQLVAGSVEWALAFGLRSARDPHSGNTLLVFNTKSTSNTYTAYAVPLVSSSANAGELRELAAEFLDPYVGGICWSEARGEFVAGVMLGGEVTALLRCDATGDRIPTPIYDVYHGDFPLLFGGADDALHLAIASDAAYDETYGTGSAVDLRVIPVR